MWSSAQITQDTEEEVQSTLRDVATQNALIVLNRSSVKTSTYYTALPMRSAFPRMQSMQIHCRTVGIFLSPPMSLNGSVSSHRRSGDKHRWLCTGSVQREIFLRMVCRTSGVLPIPSEDRLGTPEPINVFSIPYMIRVIPLSVFLFYLSEPSILKKF